MAVTKATTTYEIDASGAMKAVKRVEAEIYKATKRQADASTKLQGTVDKLNTGWQSAAAKVTLFKAAVQAAGKALDVIREGEAEIAATVGFEKKFADSAAVLKQWQEATVGIVQNTDLQHLAMKLQDLGLATEDATRLASNGLKAILASGQEATAGIEKLTNAVATGRTESLRSLGVQLDLKKAYDEYAESLGVAVSELSEADKLQVRLTETTNALATAYADVPLEDFTIGTQQLETAIGNISGEIKAFVADALSPMVSELANAINDLRQLDEITEAALGPSDNYITKLTKLQEERAKFLALPPPAQWALGGEDFLAGLDKAIAAQTALASATVKANIPSQQQAAIFKNSIDALEENIEFLKEEEKAQTKVTKSAKKLKKAVDDVADALDRIQQPERRGVEARDMSGPLHALAEAAGAARVQVADLETVAEGSRDRTVSWIQAHAAEGELLLDSVEAVNQATVKSGAVTAAVTIGTAAVKAEYEVAEALAAGAEGNIPGAIAHGAAAAQYAVVGAMDAMSAVSGGGGGSGGGAATGSGGGGGGYTPAPQPTSAPAGPSSITINVEPGALQTSDDAARHAVTLVKRARQLGMQI